MRGRDRIRRPDRVGPVPPDHRHAGRDRVEAPGRPAIGQRERARIAAEQRQVPRGVERERAPHDGAVGDLAQLVVAGVFVRARARGQHERLPPELRQVLHEAQRALDAAAAAQRREVIGDHQQAARSAVARTLMRPRGCGRRARASRRVAIARGGALRRDVEPVGRQLAPRGRAIRRARTCGRRRRARSARRGARRAVRPIRIARRMVDELARRQVVARADQQDVAARSASSRAPSAPGSRARRPRRRPTQRRARRTASRRSPSALATRRSARARRSRQNDAIGESAACSSA